MELRHLQSFLAVVRREGFTRAAEELGITQAAVSQHVAALERQLDVRLFDRINRTVTITPAGRRLIPFAQQIVDLQAAACCEVPGNDSEARGPLRIAASTVPGQVLLPELLAQMRREHPRVSESVSISDTAAATADVESGEAEVGLVGEAPRNSPLSAVAVGQDELVLVVGRLHPLARKRHMSVNELPAAPLIVREPGSGSRRCVERSLAKCGIDPGALSIQMQLNSNDAIREAVERGLGAAFLSRATVIRQIESKTLVHVLLDGCRCQRELYLITDPRRTPSPAAVAFQKLAVDWSRRAARPS